MLSFSAKKTRRLSTLQVGTQMRSLLTTSRPQQDSGAVRAARRIQRVVSSIWPSPTAIELLLVV